MQYLVTKRHKSSEASKLTLASRQDDGEREFASNAGTAYLKRIRIKRRSYNFGMIRGEYGSMKTKRIKRKVWKAGGEWFPV